MSITEVACPDQRDPVPARHAAPATSTRTAGLRRPPSQRARRRDHERIDDHRAPGGTQGNAVVDGRQEVPRRPLRLGRHRAREGMDCSGLVQKVYYELGYDLPRVSAEQAGAGRAGRRASPTRSPAT